MLNLAFREKHPRHSKSAADCAEVELRSIGPGINSMSCVLSRRRRHLKFKFKAAPRHKSFTLSIHFQQPWTCCSCLRSCTTRIQRYFFCNRVEFSIRTLLSSTLYCKDQIINFLYGWLKAHFPFLAVAGAFYKRSADCHFCNKHSCACSFVH